MSASELTTIITDTITIARVGCYLGALSHTFTAVAIPADRRVPPVAVANLLGRALARNSICKRTQGIRIEIGRHQHLHAGRKAKRPRDRSFLGMLGRRADGPFRIGP